MTIDWDNAPEGAEAAHPGNEGCYPAWYRRDTAGLIEQICPEAGVKNWTWMGGRKEFPNGHVLRPEFDKQVWTGEGLPPVRTVCVLRTKRDEPVGGWMDAEIMYSSKTAVVWRWEGRKEEFGAEWSEVEFRPIRTPEQIAAEEREKAIEDLYFTINWSESRETWPMISKARKADYAKAVDAGWRPQEDK